MSAVTHRGGRARRRLGGLTELQDSYRAGSRDQKHSTHGGQHGGQQQGHGDREGAGKSEVVDGDAGGVLQDEDR